MLPFLNIFSTEMTYQGNQCWIYCFPVMASPYGQCWIYCSSVIACQGDHCCIYCPTEQWPINVINAGYNVFQWWLALVDNAGYIVHQCGKSRWPVLDILSNCPRDGSSRRPVLYILSIRDGLSGDQRRIYSIIHQLWQVKAVSAGYMVNQRWQVEVDSAGCTVYIVNTELASGGQCWIYCH